jgi:AbrB family transcriptional regulator (stage V sporulation protein T)
VSKKEYFEKKVSAELENIIESRGLYSHRPDAERISVIEDGGSHYVSCAMPILSEGDIIGCVCSVLHFDETNDNKISDELEIKLIQTAATFLGKQLES